MAHRQREVRWNPWHGCTKISAGCKNCYVYRQDAMYGVERASSEVRKNADFSLPVRRKRDKSYKIASGSLVFTCFTSDFLVPEADEWREEAWAMIKERSDLRFFFITKRIERFLDCVPADWGRGYDHVMVGCTVENQAMADLRLPLFLEAPIRHKYVIVAPLLEKIDLSAYLRPVPRRLQDKGKEALSQLNGEGGAVGFDQQEACPFEEVSVGGESGALARVCDYHWVLDLQRQCVEHDVPFRYHQTGAKLLKDGKLYSIRREIQHSQALKAGINYKIKDS